MRERFATCLFALSFVCSQANAQAPASAPGTAQPIAEGMTSGPEPEGEAEGDVAPDAAADDGWPDISKFLDKKFGFLPIARPITEPAVGYGAAGGLMFLSKSFGDMSAGLGRPNITFVGAMGTSTKTWGVFTGDSRYWLDDHLHTLVATMYASVNLDFYGLGKTDALANNPLRYNLNPKGGMAQAKYRFGDGNFWAGLNGRFISTDVEFDAPSSTPNLPDVSSTTNMGGASVLAIYDSRSNIFTPIRGTYVEANVGMFSASDAEGPIERVELVGLQFFPLPADLYLGLRAMASATFGDAPFYFRPYVQMRGVAQMRYQGDEVAQLEAELRWQFWKRWSLLGFVGGGGAWLHFEQFDNTQGVVAGGGGFRYELARKYGIHMGIDVAGSRDTAAFYIQVGSAWMRP